MSETFVAPQQAQCNAPIAQPTYLPVVRNILDRACATCHADVQSHGAPPGLVLGQYEDGEDQRTGAPLKGAASAAGCICVAALQANPGSPLRMPLPQLGDPLCQSEQETLRNWIVQGAPRQTPGGSGAAPCLRREELRCITTGEVPAVPTYADVAPIVAGRCNSCHASGGCFGPPSQTHFRLDVESDLQHGCPGGGALVDGRCPGGAPSQVVERGVGLFEMRGELLRTAVLGLDESVNLVPAMPLRPLYGGVRRDLLPPLCANDIEVLRRWVESGRRTGSSVVLERECISEQVPGRPTWRMDVRRILAARCGQCHGEHNRAAVVPAFRLDRYAATESAPSPGVSDVVSWCAETVDPGATSLLPFPATRKPVPIVDGAIEVDNRRFELRDGPCDPGGAGVRHVRMDLRVFDLAKLVAIEATGMPPLVEEQVRAPLCATDQAVLLRWAEGGFAYE